MSGTRGKDRHIFLIVLQQITEEGEKAGSHPAVGLGAQERPRQGNRGSDLH